MTCVLQLKELKGVREIASALTQRGVTLYDLLNKEVSLREIRQSALSKAYEHDEVERLLKGSVQMMSQEMTKLNGMIDSVQSNLASLDGKIEKRKGDLDRSQKRLLTLKKVRPAFMDEFEQLQTELSQVYKVYVNRFRCLAFLQNRIEEMNREDSERKAEEKLNQAELNAYGGGGDDFLYGGLRGDGIYSGSDDESSDEMHLLNDPNMNLTTGRSSFTPSRTGKHSQSVGPGPTSTTSTGVMTGGSGNRPAPGTTSNNGLRQVGAMNGGGAQSSRARNRQPYGSMLGPEEESEESESDLILVDGDNDNSELGSDEPDDDDLLQIQKGGMTSSMGTAARRSNPISNHYANGGIGDPPPAPVASANPSAEMLNYDGNMDGYNNQGTMGNGDLSHHTGNGGGYKNGPPNHTLANGGKGYPVDNLKNGSSGKRLQQQVSRPTTSGKRRGPPPQARRVTNLDDDDDDEEF